MKVVQINIIIIIIIIINACPLVSHNQYNTVQYPCVSAPENPELQCIAVYPLCGIVHGLKVGGTSCNFPTDSCKFPRAKLVLKTKRINDFHFKFSYACVEK